jgi:hypothetical protein
MSVSRRTVLQRMDALVWWTGASAQVQGDMSTDAETRRYRPMRWLPLLPLAGGAGIIFAATAFAIPPMLYVIAAPLMAVAAAIAINGPLGRPSIDDDEREAALRRHAFFFCLAILAFANMLGGPMLLFSAALHAWPADRLYGIAVSLVLGNMTWFVSLPTLYASWKLPILSDSEVETV